MKLIADSGSTKTIWTFVKNRQIIRQEVAFGINPYQQDEPEILTRIQDAIGELGREIEEAYFYGSGITSANVDKVERSLQMVCSDAEKIEVNNDVLAAARSLCQDTAGIACILGTGSNSCLYDGKKVVSNVGGFGFILGDEGSGAVLGKQLFIDFLYEKIPSHITKILKDEHELSMTHILEQTYRTQFPNRYMASFAPFVYEHRAEPYMQDLLERHFRLFFDRKTFCYPDYQDYTYHFVGSVAHYFRLFLEKIATDYQLRIGRIEKDPMAGLIEFHANDRTETC